MFGLSSMKATITLAIVAVIVMGSCKMMKMAGCGARKPRPPKIRTAGPFDVAEVLTGASLTVEAGRRGRTHTIFLSGVQAPASGPLAQVSADHLRGMAGSTITVQYEKHGLFRGEAKSTSETIEYVIGPDGERQITAAGYAALEKQIEEAQASLPQQEEELPAAAETPVEARIPSSGIVFGASGINLNIAQIAGGYADCTSDAPEEFQDAKAKAQKDKLGIWSK